MVHSEILDKCQNVVVKYTDVERCEDVYGILLIGRKTLWTAWNLYTYTHTLPPIYTQQNVKLLFLG